MEKFDRVDLYLQDTNVAAYKNTEFEDKRVSKFTTLYNIAKSAKESNELSKSENIKKWRSAYLGILTALDSDGNVSNKKGKQLRRMAFEVVESKIDNSIPMPKMSPRYKSDLPLVSITEDFLKYELDKIYTKYVNDRSERATYIDGTSWYKVWWDSLSGTHNRSGTVKIDVCLCDQVTPQPGVLDYRDMEYIFEEQQSTTAKLYDLYGRIIVSSGLDTSKSTVAIADQSTVTVVSCYYLNENRIVGLFMYCKDTLQVICDEKDWQIRKIRRCNHCNSIQPQSDVCTNCGGHSFSYKNADVEILDKTLEVIYNPYDVGETDDEARKNEYKSKVFLEQGTEIPFYRIRQLPFIPRPAISAIDSIYGISEVFIVLEQQDSINKLLTKAEDKTMKSGNVTTKPAKTKLNDLNESMKVIDVRTVEEANMVQSKQIIADTTHDLIFADYLYDSGKGTSGVTDSFQGKKDSSATSGKAKEFSAVQTAGRIESLRVMKSAATSGLYELILKYLLAFSDESVKFVKTLPNGEVKEQCWNKYMFLEKDKYGSIYYRDDFKFNSDPAATLSQNRVAMWQETTDKFIQGALGNPADASTLKLYWNMMEQNQYPLSNVVLAGLDANMKQLPQEVQDFIVKNPDVLQMIMAQLNGDNGQGGARANSGPEGNGATHSANVTRNNSRNAVTDKKTSTAVETGGVK